jgi:hypothetical protein
MLRRTRTTKKLARRIDLQYFTRPHPLRRWRFWLSVAVPALALGWLFTQRVQGGQRAYSSGPLSRSHAVFTQQCNLCHVSRARTFAKDVSDQACLACHDAPLHQANQTFTPPCSSCHVEHKGVARLSATSDASCTQCHARLQTRNGISHYATSIDRFESTHPEFSALTDHRIDPGQVRLNHYLHLQPNLLGPDNRRVQMTCDDCHRSAEAHDSWPYAGPTTVSMPAHDTAVEKSVRTSAFMARIKFANQCGGCHTLQFDRRFGDLQAPHDRPEAVHAFVTKQFEQYIAAHPGAVHEAEPPNRQLPERIRIHAPANTSSEWVQYRVEDAEWLLWTKTCKQCHVLIERGGMLPEVVKSNIVERWLPHAQFDHYAHRMMTCVACHANAPASHNTADVLLPGIKVCQQCHRDSSTKDTAEGRCFECHQYHDWTQAKRTKGGFTIPELRGTAELHPAQVSPYP